MNNNNGNGHDKPRAIRKSLDLTKRQAILRRDACKCVFCGKGPPQVVLHVDHKKAWIICVKEGLDPDGMDNLQTVCEACNLGKLNYWDDSLDLPVFQKLPIDDNQLNCNFNGQVTILETARSATSFNAESWWAVGYPNGKWWGFKKLLGAERHRLEMQYWSKHGHPAGIGNFCWLPDDIYFSDRNDENLGELIDDSHKKYNLLPKWPIKFVADTIQTIQ
jgi:hypothetical protein